MHEPYLGIFAALLIGAVIGYIMLLPHLVLFTIVSVVVGVLLFVSNNPQLDLPVFWAGLLLIGNIMMWLVWWLKRM